MNKVYDVITSIILDKLSQGTIPWKQPWIGGKPKNLISKKEYRGFNSLFLGSMGFSNPWFVTFKQAKQKGGAVKKGEKGIPVIFWKSFSKEDDNGNEKSIPVLRYYTVFNVEQCENIEYPKLQSKNNEEIENCEGIISGYRDGPKIENKEPRAYYSPIQDTVNMPKPELFNSSEEYYSTIFHELAHSTGHESRLNRSGITSLNYFGSHEYSREELVAEFAAAMLCGHTGIEPRTIDNSAAYIASWSKKLKKDKKLIIEAASRAQKAADYILGEQNEN